MKKLRRLLITVVLLAVAVLVNFVLITYPKSYSNDSLQFWMTAESDLPVNAHLYYIRNDEPEDTIFTENEQVTASYSVPGTELEMGFTIPADVRALRLDLADTDDTTIRVKNIHLNYNDRQLQTFTLDDQGVTENHDNKVVKDGDTFRVTTNSADSYFVLNNPDVQKDFAAIDQSHAAGEYAKRVLICVAFDILILLLICRGKQIAQIPIKIWKNRGLILRLGRNDFKTRFAGSAFGTFWAFVQPLVTVFVYWFVFSKALNVGTQSTKAGIPVPYVLWLLAGLVPWFFFSDALSSGSNVMVEYSYLVKKVVFDIETLPVVKVVSSFIVHLFFIALTVVFYAAYPGFNHLPDLYTLQMLYYTFCMVILVTALGYFNSALVVMFRDWAQVVNILIQIGVWATPIMWNIDAMNIRGGILTVLRLNPMYYVVMGYRDSLISEVWFWQRPYVTVYFWAFTGLAFIFGTWVFRKLKPHFADVL